MPVPTFERTNKYGNSYRVLGNSTDVRKCNKCGEFKNQEDFHIAGADNRGNRRLKTSCASCYNKDRIKRRNLMPSAPLKPSTCEGCHKDIKIFMDHDHEKNYVRGWLCQVCNTGIGKCGDNKKGLEQKIKYLDMAEKRYFGDITSPKI